MSAHPKPSDMAQEAYPDGKRMPRRTQEARDACEAGIIMERARVAAWLRETSDAVRKAPRAEATVALLADLADELEDKPIPSAALVAQEADPLPLDAADIMRRTRESVARGGAHVTRFPAAMAAHACLACGRHPDTHASTGDDRCGACGLGDAREVAT